MFFVRPLPNPSPAGRGESIGGRCRRLHHQAAQGEADDIHTLLYRPIDAGQYLGIGAPFLAVQHQSGRYPGLRGQSDIPPRVVAADQGPGTWVP